MEKQTFSIEINASTGEVWQTLFTDDTYPKWANVFYEGSYAVTDWKEGSKALFLGPERSGIIGVIETSARNERMVIKYTGEMIKGVEDFEGPGAKQVIGATESYTLTPKGDGTLLTVELSGGNFSDEIRDFFLEVWPKALEGVKELAEGAAI